MVSVVVSTVYFGEPVESRRISTTFYWNDYSSNNNGGSHKVNSSHLKKRRYLVWALFFTAASTLIFGAILLQIDEPVDLAQRAESRSEKIEEIQTDRGNIFDRNNELIAVSLPHYELLINPSRLFHTKENWTDIAKVLNRPVSELERVIRENSARKGVILKARKGADLQRELSPQNVEVFRGLLIGGAHLMPFQKRHYPLGPSVSQLAGFTSRNNRGQEGIEKAFDSILAGKAGNRRVLQDAKGRIVKTLNVIDAVIPGEDLRLSIDSGVQYAAYRALEKAVIRENADAGSAVVMDPHNGEILAIVSYPSYNPNNSNEKNGSFFRNRAVTDAFEPGSTLKPFTIAMALKSGHFLTDATIDTSPGYFYVGSDRVSDPFDRGILSLSGVLTESSNVGSAKIAMTLPYNDLWDILKSVGLGNKSGLPLGGESSGKLSPHSTWEPIEHATHSYGYGMQVTLVQLARAYSVFANGGWLLPLTLTTNNALSDRKRVLEEEIALHIREMLERVVLEGGGKLAKVNGYSVGGKTGTVRKFYNGAYSNERHLALFAGMTPAINPKLVAVVMIDRPKGKAQYGGQVAAPVFSEIMYEATRILGIPPDVLEILKPTPLKFADAASLVREEN
jgi:cell division protein FtsI (penicillin-binding protein 3)